MTDLLTSETAYDYVEAYYAKCEGIDHELVNIHFGQAPADFGVPSMRLQATYTDDRGVTCIDLWDVWVERYEGAEPYLYGEC